MIVWVKRKGKSDKLMIYKKETNLYSLFLKTIGYGFLLIGIIIAFLSINLNIFITCLGLSMGIIFIGLGEIINILQKIYDKENDYESSGFRKSMSSRRNEYKRSTNSKNKK